MKKKYYLILALALIGLKSMAAQDVSEENIVEFDLKTKEIKATQGVNINYGDTVITVFEASTNENDEKIFLNKSFSMETNRLEGNIRIEGESAEINPETNDGIFNNAYSWLEVGHVTGAEKPNDKIYFGGEKLEHNQGEIQGTNIWLTTDPKVDANRNLNDLGYYLAMNSFSIIPDNHITLKDINLFIQGHDVMPWTFPWYRFNIRSGSEVPLFPSWGDADDYGFHISMGTIYESEDKKFRGGIAPKFADEMGLLLGRFENWYTFDKIGESRLNITDLLLWKKEDDNKKNRIGREDESFDDRWDVEYSHNYNGDKGFFNFDFQSLTYNMNDALSEVIEDYDQEGKFNYIDNNGLIQNNRPLGNIPDMGDYSNYYTLNTSLKELGANKDITLDAKVKLTDDKKAYSYILADRLDDLGYESQSDDDLYSDVRIAKDNENYTAEAYYNYLYDGDNGSSITDMASRKESFGFLFKDKIRNISTYYNESKGDKNRALNLWERNPNLSNLQEENEYGLTYDYSPWTVTEYDVYNNENYGIIFGEYSFIGDSKVDFGYSYTDTIRELNLENNPFREAVFGSDTRISQYNFLEDTTYEEVTENIGGFNIYSDIVNLSFSGGTSKEIIETREGLYDGSVRTFMNKSDFYEVGLNKRFSLGSLGELYLLGSLRENQFTDGRIENTNTENNDSARKYFGELTHSIETDNFTNKFGVMYQDYSYDGDKNQEYGRLINKENILKFNENVIFNINNTEVEYLGQIEKREDSFDEEKSLESLDNTIIFRRDDKKIFSLYYNEEDKYLNTDTIESYKTLEDRDYGFSLYKGDHELYFKNKDITNFISDRELNIGALTTGNLSGDLNEDIKEQTIGYVYNPNGKKLTLQYSQGTDEASVGVKDVLDIDNKKYSISYEVGEEITNSFGISYGDYQGNYVPEGGSTFNTGYNSDVLTLRYSYKDKRMSDEELKYYASKEFNKPENQITPNDILRMRNVFDEGRERSDYFNLGRAIDERINYYGDLRRSFDAYVSIERNKSDEVSGSYFDQIEDFNAGIFYSQDRVGFGYIYNEDASIDYTTGKRNLTEKEHELSFHAKIGKPSEAWRTKMYVQFNDDVSDINSHISEMGVEIGKERDYYEWSVAYIREYSLETRDYEWKAALQFTLLTFPNNTIFSIGAKENRGDKDSKIKPDGDIFGGIGVDDLKD